MFYSKLIFYFYLFLTILAVLCPIKISFFDFLPGILLMWIYYFIFISGSKIKGKIVLKDFKPIEQVGKFNKFLIIVTISHLLFYPLYINFYTGSSVMQIISSLRDGVSTYALYQSNFENSNLGELSLTKIPFIFGHGILRFLFLTAIFRTIIYGKVISMHEYLCILIMVLMIFFVGISRGTSFELYDITTIFLFSIAVRRILRGYSAIFSKKVLIRVIVVVLIVTSYFAYNITVRMGENFSFFDSQDFDKTSLVYKISKPLSLVLYSLYGYFLFGLHFTSVIISELFFGSFDGFFASLIPNGISIFNIDRDFPSFVNRFVDIGVMWRPDSATIIQNYGILLAFALIYVLGFFCKQLYGLICTNIPALILMYFIVYFFLSLPVGGFISVSSANQISILLGLITYKYNFFSKWLNIKDK